MKRAVLYARVSSDAQQKEGTIDSQLIALRKQVSTDKNVLVHEYIDNGYSGAKLDRPGLGKLRKDLKRNTFDTIYFYSADRVARDVIYQNIIISELLKYKKQIIINGQDYVDNPENKFSLTVLGAVAELERAKIMERMMRGKQYRLREGNHPGTGHNIYGYDYHKKTPYRKGSYSINESEANTIRYIFETYANGDIGLQQICRHLSDMGAKTKNGGKWSMCRIKDILKNQTYTGVRYHNKQTYAELEGRNFKTGKRITKQKLIERPRAEWVAVEMPKIISIPLFKKVQKRFEYNKKHYRNPKKKQLLSGLVRCGQCGLSFYAYRRKQNVPAQQKSYYKRAYKCTGTRKHLTESTKNAERKHCYNKEIQGKTLEMIIWKTIGENLLNPEKLQLAVDFIIQKKSVTQEKVEKQLRQIERKMRKVSETKHRVLDLYADGELDKVEYSKKCTEYDNQIFKLDAEHATITQLLPALQQDDVIKDAMKTYCQAAYAGYIGCIDQKSTREFMMKFIDKIVIDKEAFEIHGQIPIENLTDNHEVSEINQIPFAIKSEITREDLYELRMHKKLMSTLKGFPFTTY